MRIKLGLLIFALILVFALLANYYIIGTLETDAKQKLQQEVRNSFLAYHMAYRVNANQRIENAEKFAAEQELITALGISAETPEAADDKHFKLYEKLEVISRLRHSADLWIVIDKDGMELARTLVATWKKNQYGSKKAVKLALEGKSSEDVWKLGRKIMLVDVVPVRNETGVIGGLIMANSIDEELINQERQIAVVTRESDTDTSTRSSLIVSGAYGRTEHAGPKLEISFADLAFFSRNSVIKSSLNTQRQAMLNAYLQENGSAVAEWLEAKHKYFEKKVRLGENVYFMTISPFPTHQDDALIGVIMLRSETSWLKAYAGSRNFLLVVSLLLAVLGISVSFLVVQKAYDAIDFILEGAHQIIVGNKDYQFASADEYLNQIGQTLNLTIAILLGKYIPEDEDEAASMSLRGSLDTGRAGVGNQQDRMLIETMDEKPAEESDDESVSIQDEDSYFDALFDEFIAAKKNVGDDISQVTKQRMIAKLKRAEEKLIEKHGCARVKFSVNVEQNKVTLKPTPIWK